jgi:hypothetical protein
MNVVLDPFLRKKFLLPRTLPSDDPLQITLKASKRVIFSLSLYAAHEWSAF